MTIKNILILLLLFRDLDKDIYLPIRSPNLEMIDLSQCDSGKGAAVMYDLLYNRPQKVIMLAGCSTVCTTVAEAAQLWNLVTVCYGASSPALSNRYAGQPASSVMCQFASQN